MIGLLVAIALAISIGVGYATKINTGLIAFCFAYIIGVFFMKMEPAEVVALWPIKVFFDIFSVTLLFAVALDNGTLEKIAQKMLHGSRKLAWAMVFVFFFTAVIVAALGAGFFAVMAFLAPAALLICRELKIEPLIGGLAVMVGAQAGSNFMSSLNGIVFDGLFRELKYSESDSFLFRTAIFIAYLVFTFLVLLGFTLYYRHKAKKAGTTAGIADVAQVEPFTGKQKGTLYVMGVFLLFALVPSIMHVLFPAVGWITSFSSSIFAPMIAVIIAVIALAFKLADNKAVISRVPWNILIMLSGVGMLVSVATQAGTFKAIASWLGSDAVPTILVPVLLAIVAAIINCFGSFIGVTAPALYPIVPLLAHLTGLSPILLFLSMTVGGLAMVSSPYSEGGGMLLGLMPDEKERDVMFKKQLTVTLPIMGLGALVFSLILTLIFH
ncbi:MAG: SLC13 family permease [Pseudoclavibacter sp.]